MGRVLVVAMAVLALSGCASPDRDNAPAACTDDHAVPTALHAAPGEVRLADGSKLSDCLVKTPETADLEQFSVAVLDEASFLRRAAHKDPAGPALVELGYLQGALQRGADTGIHDQFMRRFEDELLGVDTKSAAFRRGHAAGLATG